MLRLLLLCSCIVFIGTSPLHKEHFTLHVGHVNDFHARFDETNNYGGSCKSKKCIGGFSRLYSELIKLKKNDPNVILLNAGDNFQGTFYYSFYKWNITQHFMNKIPFDAYTLGNHEFDDEIKGVVPFIQSLKAPTVVSNIDDSLEPTFQHIYTKSVVIERNGKKIGIIGVTTDTLPSIAKSGKLKLQDESESVNKEAKRLVEVEKVFTIIVLSHCGFDHDQRIAKNAPEKVSLIVGGHTHTFLYSGATKLGPDEVQGPYPTVVKRKDGKSVLITQASAFCKYYGNITVSYDKFGEMVKWDGAPVFLDTTVPQSQEINKELDAWRAGLVAIGQKVLGSTTKLMNNEECYYKECTLGNIITDAYIHYYSNKNTSYPLIAAVNAGGIRSTIPTSLMRILSQ
ncbi:apyrase isoform X2 [Aethina tumida]|uniref:apyrase isoform X2 n=1 Tax=Aethina tumida TaxID=116153 RepID=UPI0021480FC2|nr:apyrase isoform X2 [Aethina tumida]